MIFFYVDDAGGTGAHHVPLLEGETPLFSLSAVALSSSVWRDLDRGLLQLKRTYFRTEIDRELGRTHDAREEYYEVKGTHLLKPSEAGSYRNRTFVWKVLELCEHLGARFFAAVWLKDPNRPVSGRSTYTQSLQILSERFQFHCEEMSDTGIVLVDSQTRTLDFRVAASHLSYLFGHPTGQTLTALVEAPMFVNSVLSAGMQISDIVGSCVYGNYYLRHCHTVPGLFDGSNLVSPKKFASGPESTWESRAPAHDYTHCGRYWSKLSQMEFKRSAVPPPTPGHPSPGYYGFRLIRP